MNAQDVAKAVHAVVETVSKTPDQVHWNEMTTRYAVVDPILSALGWRIRLPWECQLQYQLGQRGSADYALWQPPHPTFLRCQLGMALCLSCKPHIWDPAAVT